MRRILLGLLAVLGMAGAAWAANGPSYPAATQPLGSIPDIVLFYQGSGCSSDVGPCNTVTSTSLRFGQPIQANCLSILTPFQYQQCIDTTQSPPVLKEYIGIVWWPLIALSPTVGPSFVIGGGTTVKVTVNTTTTITAPTTIWVPSILGDVTFNLPTTPLDGELHTIINDCNCTANAMTVSGNGNSVGPGGNTTVVLAVPGQVSVVYSTATARWEFYR